MIKLKKFIRFIMILSVTLALLLLSPFLITLGIVILVGALIYTLNEEYEEMKNKKEDE